MKDTISRWIDGDLPPVEAEQALRRALTSDDWREEFAVFHAIGDAMRTGDVAARKRQARIFAALAAEPTLLAPSAAKAAADRLDSARDARASGSSMLDNPRFKLGFAAAASAATVAVVGWIGLQDRLAPAPVAAVAQAPLSPRMAAVVTPGATVVPVAVQDYWAVHRQMPDAGIVQASHRADRNRR